jgi:putative nucleotidyltransferase with HDIG domain
MEINADLMMPIPIDDLVNGVKIPCDVFVRLGGNHFVMLAASGGTTQTEQLFNYQSKKVDYLWVSKKDYYKIVHQSTSLAGLIVNRKDVADSQKADLLTRATGTVMRQVENLGLDLNTYATARHVAEAVFILAEQHSGLTALLESLKSASDYHLAHSMAVSVMSTILGQELGYTKKATLEKLSLAGLLHDIGMKALPPEIAKKSMGEMSAEEIQKWETHPYRGMQMLQTLGVVPDDVIAIVYEHHENSIGQGFPQQIRDVKLHPLGKIIALADQFAELTLPGPNTPMPKSAREALMHIEHTMKMPFNKECFRALRRSIEKEKAA